MQVNRTRLIPMFKPLKQMIYNPLKDKLMLMVSITKKPLNSESVIKPTKCMTKIASTPCFVVLERVTENNH